jgi:hypothetical protein
LRLLKERDDHLDESSARALSPQAGIRYETRKMTTTIAFVRLAKCRQLPICMPQSPRPHQVKATVLAKRLASKWKPEIRTSPDIDGFGTGKPGHDFGDLGVHQR